MGAILKRTIKITLEGLMAILKLTIKITSPRTNYQPFTNSLAATATDTATDTASASATAKPNI